MCLCAGDESEDDASTDLVLHHALFVLFGEAHNRSMEEEDLRRYHRQLQN